jgi:hypothetical protein
MHARAAFALTDAGTSLCFDRCTHAQLKLKRSSFVCAGFPPEMPAPRELAIEHLEQVCEYATCGICHNIMHRAVLACSDGHPFCRHCLENWISRALPQGQVVHKCPICRGDLGNLVQLRELDGVIGNLKVFCQIPKTQIAQNAHAHHLQLHEEDSSDEDNDNDDNALGDDDNDDNALGDDENDDNDEDALIYEDYGAGSSAVLPYTPTSGQKRGRSTKDTSRTTWSKVKCRAILTELWGNTPDTAERVSSLRRCEPTTLRSRCVCVAVPRCLCSAPASSNPRQTWEATNHTPFSLRLCSSTPFLGSD